MEKHEAVDLVTDTFTHAYEKANFHKFILNLIPIDSQKSFTGKFMAHAFEGKIISYGRLTKYIDPNGKVIDVLMVEVKNQHMLENARTLQRNFIARYLNGSRGGAMKDAALVAFYAKDCDYWRFSFVKMDYELDEKEQKIKKNLTPARRYSFLVGEGEKKTYTVRKQWLPLLESSEKISLEHIENAFNIEVVTKEFFQKYKSLYENLKAELESFLAENQKANDEFANKNISADDFAKRLLGQIVFLYFLQKKGWLGVAKGEKWGSGRKDFLQAMYDKQYTPYNNFFNDVLEPLFYEALATERSDNYYDHLKCRIPFLNGGLFEPIGDYDWVNVDILLDNKIFEKIFEVFDLYNFTIREDEPLDKEVAVDPEMLGKVFEKLIPENERKGSGTYYTPREIVHYMCQESLINYLDSELNLESRPIKERGQQALISDPSKDDLLTKHENVYMPIVSRNDLAEFIFKGDVAEERDALAVKKGDIDKKSLLPESIRKYAKQIDVALENVRACDPAIGSGAFPVGMMSEIVRARKLLNSYLGEQNRTPYDFKRNAIQKSLYGVDMESSAVDIAKLRLWLSLVVDEDDFNTIQPLPNLDYKIVAGNSLIGFPFRTQKLAKKLQRLTPLKEKYFNSTSHKEKMELRTKIDSEIQDIYSLDTSKSYGAVLNFDFKVSFFEVFEANKGFDIVIANPPYLEVGGANFKKELKILYQISLKQQWPNHHKYIQKRSDLMIYFYPKALEILNQKGTGCFITSNSWFNTNYGKEFQVFMLENSNFNAVIDSSYKYFSGKDAPQINTAISVFSNKNAQSSKLRFVHVNENIENIKQSLTFVKGDEKNNSIDVKVYRQDDENLVEYKWGFLFRLPEWIEPLIPYLIKTEADSNSAIKIGIGLSLSKSSYQEYDMIESEKKFFIPFLRKEVTFNVDKVKHCFHQNIDGFNRVKTPIFIMPRGISRHFCALNEFGAYSDNGVEIYETGKLNLAEKTAIWAYCNSSLFWLLRELNGRTNLGGGLLKSEVTDVSKIVIPYKILSKEHKKLDSIMQELSQREPMPTVEEVNTSEHKKLDKLVLATLGWSEYEKKIQKELIKRVTYRFDRAKT